MLRFTLVVAGLAATALTGLAKDVELSFPHGSVRVSGRSVEVTAPYTHVRVNGVVEVEAPHTNVRVETKQAPAAKPVAKPAEELLPAPKVVESAPILAMSHYDFGYSFKPAAGNYTVVLIHPRTGCPVRVCFSLPCGCPKVEVRCDEIEFDYGKREVEIEFRKDGRVVVEYH
jgi:hypothetical protein